MTAFPEGHYPAWGSDAVYRSDRYALYAPSTTSISRPSGAFRVERCAAHFVQQSAADGPLSPTQTYRMRRVSSLDHGDGVIFIFGHARDTNDARLSPRRDLAAHTSDIYIYYYM